MSAPFDVQSSTLDVGRSGAPRSRGGLAALDYSVLQQCMHCGLCLPTCPTYDETKLERHSPRGRIALMRAIADGELAVTKAFGEEMYYCLGCLACTTACPAGVNYAELFETARAEIEEHGVLDHPKRDFIRWAIVKVLFTRPRLLRLVGRLLWLWQGSGAQSAFRRLGLTHLLPANLRRLEPQAPTIQAKFSHQLIRPIEKPDGSSLSVQRSALNVERSLISAPPVRRVAVLTGCVQDLAFADVNRATVDVLLANGCEVHTPPVQPCCGSLHAHNGDLTSARALARRQLDLINPADFDAIISNAGGCGSHLKTYGHLLHDDPTYAARAAIWDTKLKDIHEYLVALPFRHPGLPQPTDHAHPTPAPSTSLAAATAKTPAALREARSSILDVGCSKLDVGRSATAAPPPSLAVTYHESCHLCHGQKVSAQPRAILRAIPGVELRECAEATWCCGSAGIYNITQPDTSARLLDRKLGHLARTGANTIATANPGCHLQLENGLKAACPATPPPEVVHPIVLLARAYRAEAPTTPAQPPPPR